MGDTPNSSLNSGGAAHGMIHTYWLAGLGGTKGWAEVWGLHFQVFFLCFGESKRVVHGWVI